MRKFLLSLGLACMSSVGMQAQSFDVTFTDGNAGWPSISSYSAQNTSESDFGGVKWTTYGFNNNNKGWSFVRAGYKSTTKGEAYIKSDDSLTGSFSSVTIHISDFIRGTINSTTLLVSSDADFTNPTSYELSEGFAASGEYTINIDDPQANSYYKLVFNYTNTQNKNGVFDLEKISFTAAGGSTVTVAAPTIELEEADGGYKVVMTAEEGADIYYTVDESVPTEESTKYTSPVEVWESTTFKAIAVKDGVSSAVKTFVATVPMLLEDFSALYGIEPSDIPSAGYEIQVNAPMTVLYQSADNRYLYLRCGNQNALFYADKGKGSPVDVGSTLQTAKGTLKNYNGLIEITNYTLGALTPGTLTVEPTKMESVEGIGVNMQSFYLKLTGVSISVVNDMSGTITDADGNTIALYNNLGIEIANAENVDVTGFVGVYKTTAQFMPCAIEEAVVADPVEAPTFEYVPDNYSIRVKITAEEGATIYYTVDGSEPTVDSDEYTAPVAVTEYDGLTIKAIAVKGNSVSDVATFEAKYFKDATYFGYDFGELTNYADDEDYEEYEDWEGFYLHDEEGYVVVYQNEDNYYIYDGNSYMLFVGDFGTLEPGTKLSAVAGFLTRINGLVFMNDAFVVATDEIVDVPEPTTIALNKVEDELLSEYIKLEGVKLVADGEGYKLVAGDAELALVNKFDIEISAMEAADVVGFIGADGAERVLYPVAIDESEVIPEPIEAPTFEYVYENYSVRVKIIAEEGATIYYTKDGSEPTTSSIEYVQAFDPDYSGITTIKAIAVKGNQISEVATFEARYHSYLQNLMYLNLYSPYLEDEYIMLAPGNYMIAYQKDDFAYAYDIDNECYTLLKGENLVEGALFTAMRGEVLLDNGQPYVTNLIITFAEGEGEAPEAVSLEDLEELADADLGSFVKLEGVEMTKDGDNYKLTSADVEVLLVNLFGVEIPDAEAVDITGFVGVQYDEDEEEVPAFYPILIKKNETVGISEINAEGADVEYFNLQGVRVANPENGLYIRRQGDKATKVLVK